MVGKYPCQQLHGGHPMYVKISVDEDGMCNHPECEPEESPAKTEDASNIVQQANHAILLCTYTGTDCHAKNGNQCMCVNPCEYRKTA